MADAIDIGRRPAGVRKNALLAWVWPAPRDERDTGAGWLETLLAWMWPTPTYDGTFGRRRGLMATLFAGAWPSRAVGPSGEICAVAPWQANRGRKRGAIFMMIAASAIAAPTFMEGNGAYDAGRLNLFRGGADAGDAGSVGGGSGSGGSGAGAQGFGGGAGGGQGGQGGSDGGGAGDGGGVQGGDGGGTPDTVAPQPGDGLTFLDPTTNPGVDPTDFGGDTDFGLGGFGGGGGGGGAGGGGTGGGGGGQPTTPTDPTTPTTPTDPTTPLLPPTPPTDRPAVPGDPTVPTPGGGGPTVFFDPDPPGGGGKDPSDPPGGTVITTPVPEPATWAMMILGFGAVGYVIRRRRFAATVA